METTATALNPIVYDFSISGLFLAADPIVKAVIIILILASVACWTIVFEKIVRLTRARQAVAQFETAAHADGAIAGLDRADGLGGSIISAGLREWRDYSESSESRADRRDRIERAMRIAMTAELRRIEPGLSFLATVGSTAPFIGLFGTVWGIMNSFASIATNQDTSLSVVAPGIAEALFATALGLVAAIPAVIAYNRFATQLGRLGQRLNVAIHQVGSLMIRTGQRAARTPAGAGE
jgi:biopolymer transport protein TolQ